MGSAPSAAVVEMARGSDGARLTGASRPSDTLLVDVLGPIRVSDADGRDVTPEGALQRRLLALLVLRRGQVVSVDAAIDALWPARPPRDPVAALQNHLFRLRRGLPEDAIESTGTGYRLAASRIDLDADRLAAALAVPEADPAVLATIDAVLERWQGPAYPELDDVDDGRAEAVRLDELRVRAVEVRAECRLAAGDTDGLAGELAGVGRRGAAAGAAAGAADGGAGAARPHAEALRVYDDFRRLLGDELGIEPSPALAAQHADLLAGTDMGDPWEPASRLPVPATSLVGREALVAEVIAMVEAHRLVTLVGPGGVGKTRLLVEVGHRSARSAPGSAGGAVRAGHGDPGVGRRCRRGGLGIDGRPGVGLADRVAAALAGTEIVLLLDNCEHVLDPIAALVERCSPRCPNVTRGGHEPGAAAGGRRATVRRADAAVGGRRRAGRAAVRRAGPGGGARLRAGRGELAVVAEIVRRLDGLPLAIELAAARLHTHDLDEVAAGLDHRFDLLSSGYRTSSRHGSLGAAVSWSFGLLDAPLQRDLRRPVGVRRSVHGRRRGRGLRRRR